MNAKDKKLITKYISLNKQPIKTAQCKNGVCHMSNFVEAGKLIEFINSLEVKSWVHQSNLKIKHLN